MITAFPHNITDSQLCYYVHRDLPRVPSLAVRVIYMNYSYKVGSKLKSIMCIVVTVT